ncbi:MAG: hypothetical protein AMXMBFR53_21950 [Gemmatimonadota bacterium]
MYRRSTRLVIPLVVLLSAGVSACASSGGGRSRESGGGDMLMAEEMAEWASQDLFEVVRKLRPRWLQSRAPATARGRQSIAIILDGVRQDGGPEMMRSFRAGDIGSVQFMNARDATTRYGTDMTGGALIILTKR